MNNEDMHSPLFIQTSQDNINNYNMMNDQQLMNLFFNFIKSNQIQNVTNPINYKRKEIILSFKNNNYNEWCKYIKSVLNYPFNNYFEDETITLPLGTDEQLYDFIENTLSIEVKFNLVGYEFNNNPRLLFRKIKDLVIQEKIEINKKKLTEMSYNYEEDIVEHLSEIGNIISTLGEYGINYTEYEQINIIINTLPMDIKKEISTDIHKNNRRLLDSSIFIINAIKDKQNEYNDINNEINYIIQPQTKINQGIIEESNSDKDLIINSGIDEQLNVMLPDNKEIEINKNENTEKENIKIQNNNNNNFVNINKIKALDNRNNEVFDFTGRESISSKITLLCNKFKHQIGILAYLIKSIMRLINQKMQKVKRNSTINLHIFSIAICTFNSNFSEPTIPISVSLLLTSVYAGILMAGILYISVCFVDIKNEMTFRISNYATLVVKSMNRWI
ncbi:hypothetical protein H8356DRAFT_1416629 [Neocallimastix lanati (nom. inval.)]|nr:hypothetical protein H8356DRAFT_1416629 [Neocallimastix sp. JGI-2020a]